MPTWIRVRDNTTGHEFDLEQRSLRGGVTVIDGYPTVSGPGARPRPPKPFVGKDGQPATPGDRTPEQMAPPATEPDLPDTEPDPTPATPADTEEEPSP